MRKTYLLNGFVAMALGLAAVGCTHDADYSEHSRKAQIIAEYNNVFVKVFGEPAADQDWGFGSGTRSTRAASTWDGGHTCAVSDWEKVFAFEKPQDAVDLTRSDLFPDGNNLGSQFANVTDWYIPADFNGSLSLHNMNLKGNVYVLGKLTDLQQVNYNGTVTFYVAKKATLKYTVSSGNRHNIINAGNLEVAKWSNVGELYNGGSLTVTDTDVPNTAKIYSNGEATIEFPNGGDLKATCDIHGTITVGNIDKKEVKNLKIQNSTSKYICGIVSLGTVENVDGPFYTSYVEADKFTVDGNQTYLLAGGHIKANTVHVYNSGCSIKAAAGSTALIEAKDFIFANDNDFERTVSDNVYFLISGSIDMTGVTNGSVKEKKKFDNAEAYIAANGNPNNKLNSGTATGSPACGNEWTIGEGKVDEWIFQCRIFAEDLSASESSDFDFNDVVFDVYYKSNGDSTKVQVLAAGGTLPLTVAGVDVKEELFGVSTSTMVNTGPDIGVVDGLTADPIFLPGKVDPDKIPIVVKKGNILVMLTAHTGEPASKFAVKEKIDWAPEYHHIVETYPDFADWVGDPSVKWWKNKQ